MTRQRPFARRRLLAGVVAGGGALGAGVVDPSTASAAGARVGLPALVPLRKLRPGDVILGPDAMVVRVASVDKLTSGRRRVRYTHPQTGVATAFDARADRTGYPSRQRFVLFARGADVATVRLTSPAVPPPVEPQVVDGGAP